jgi:hypothetical protein
MSHDLLMFASCILLAAGLTWRFVVPSYAAAGGLCVAAIIV